jgi:hypothetical protein
MDVSDVDAELQQFTVNVGSAPEWIVAAQHADQLANLVRHRGTAGLAVANLPAPEQAKALPLPADHRSGPDDGNVGLPAVPDQGEPCPEKAVSGAQLRPLDRASEHPELMT